MTPLRVHTASLQGYTPARRVPQFSRKGLGCKYLVVSTVFGCRFLLPTLSPKPSLAFSDACNFCCSAGQALSELMEEVQGVHEVLQHFYLGWPSV